MITSVKIFNESGQYIELPLDDFSSPYFVKKIDGLGPIKADISMSTYATKDGGVFQNARGNSRNIVMQLGLNPTFSNTNDPYGELRRALYLYFSPKSKVVIHFVSSNMETVYIDGWVESFEPTIFAKDPDMTISIVCPEPYFSSLTPELVTREGSGDIYLQNNGTVEAGLTILIDGFYSSTPDFTITQMSPTTSTMTYIGDLYSSGQMLSFHFVTDLGHKSALFKLNDVGYVPGATNPLDPFDGINILGWVDGWLTLPVGEAVYRFDLDETSYPLPRIHMFFYQKYVGL